jgi:hypothetical protein
MNIFVDPNVLRNQSICYYFLSAMPDVRCIMVDILESGVLCAFETRGHDCMHTPH